MNKNKVVPKYSELQAKLEAKKGLSKESAKKPEKEPEKPVFMLPAKYTMGWTETYDLDGEKEGWHVLRNPEGEDVGFFEFVPGKKVEQVLKAHIKIEIVNNSRDDAKAMIVLKDSDGNSVGSWELHQHARSAIEKVVKYLANR